MSCPQCGSTNIETGTTATEEGEHIRWFVCNDCDWEDDDLLQV